MPLPDLRELLLELDLTTHGDRMRIVGLLGRDHAGDPALPALLDGLAAESAYHRGLSLTAASAAGLVDRLRAARRDPSARIRHLALVALGPAHLTVGELVDTMARGSAEERRELRQFVNRHGLTDLAEAVVDDVRRELGDREAAALLATCAEPTVRRLLPELSYALRNLSPLAHRHPVALLDHLETELAARSRRRRDALWRQVGHALPALVCTDADRVLRLVEGWGPTTVLPDGLAPVLRSLVRFDAERIGRLVVRREHVEQLRWRLPSWLRRSAPHFGRADQIAVARALRENDHLFFAWLGALAPSVRADVFAQALDDLDTSARTWAVHHLDVLPRDLRHAEARRILDLRSMREFDALALPYVALLPLAEARERLTAHARRAKAEERAYGYQLLISCARAERSPEAMSEVLDLAARLQNDQDPVRLAAIGAFAATPAARFDDRHVDQLRSLVRSVVDARDTSPETLRRLAALAVELAIDAATEPTSGRFRFAIEVLDSVAGPTGSISFPRLDRLPRGAEVAIVDALLPRLERDAERDRFDLTLALATALGRRAWAAEDLQRLVHRATRAASDGTVRAALTLWLADPRHRSERVGQAVAADESTLSIHAVLDTVVRTRQDLLDLLLQPRALQGRFLNGEVRFVPVIDGGFDAWLPRQCAAYRSALDALIDAPATADWTRVGAVGTLARLPELGAAAVAPYLGADEVFIEEAALAGLAWTDRPADALPYLLQHTGTDRARVAVYAATRCARFVPRDAVRGPLEAVLLDPSAKVTSKKEAARLLGTHRPAGALDVLLGVGGADAHRDLRIAVGRSVRAFLGDPRVVTFLASLVAGADDEARSILETTPEQLPPAARTTYAALVVDAAASPSTPVRAEALAALAEWSPWSPGAAAVACRAIDDVAVGPTWRTALRSLGVMLEDGTAWDAAAILVTALAGRVDTPDRDAAADRDRPSAQRLRAVVDTVASLSRPERRDRRDELHRLADLVRAGGGDLADEVALRLAAVDWAHATPLLTDLARRLDDHPLLAADAADAVSDALDRDAAAWGPGSLDGAIDHLRALGSAGSGAVALALVQATGGRYGWPESSRSRLRQLRAHPIGDVATLARSTWTASE